MAYRIVCCEIGSKDSEKHQAPGRDKGFTKGVWTVPKDPDSQAKCLISLNWRARGESNLWRDSAVWGIYAAARSSK